jgi:hypothetical protein
VTNICALLGLVLLASLPASAELDTSAEIIPYQDADTIVVPIGSPVQFSGNENGAAIFKGQVLLTGTYFYGDSEFNDSGDEDPSAYEFWPQAYIALDKEVAVRLPHFVKRNDAARYTIYLTNPETFAEAIVPTSIAERVRCRTCEAASGRIEIWVDQFSAKIQCDKPHFEARFLRVHKSPPNGLSKLPSQAC